MTNSYNQFKEMQKSSIVFYTNNHEGSGCYYKHLDLGMITTYESAANSVIVSLAEYLVWKFPSLPCPGSIRTNDKPDFWINTFPNYACGLDQMYLPWTKLIVKAVESGNVIRNNDECLYKIAIQSDYGLMLQAVGFQQVNYLGEFKWDLISEDLKAPFSVEEQPIVIFATCSIIEIRQFFYGQFFNNEKWVYFNILNGNIPTDKDLSKASAVIVPGGEKSVYERIPEIEEFSKVLAAGIHSNKKLKYLGICFGAQLLTHALGGSVGKSDKVHVGVIKVLMSNKNRKHFPFEYLDDLYEQSQFKVIQYHGDEIKVLPQNFEIIATSSCAEKQIVGSKDGRMLGIQAHPEYCVERSRLFEIQTELQKSGSKDEIDKIIQRKDIFDNARVVRSMIGKFLCAK